MRATLFALSLALLGTSAAFPSVNNAGHAGGPHASAHKKRQTGFDPVKQKVDISGKHAFQPPGPNDQRGPCPGLNTMANHGYIDRSGVTTFDEAVDGCQKVFNFGLDTCIGVTILGLIYGGNIVTQKFSIDNMVPGLGTPPLIGNPPGLRGTHNKMEGDASPTRGDAYINNGDSSTLSMEHFKHLHDLGSDGRNIDGSAVIKHRKWTREKSIAENPHYFSGPVPVVIVSSLVHFLTTRAFSNHSVDYPNGFLNQEVVKSFHGVNGSSENWSYQRGGERIPDTWYRRRGPYTLVEVSKDLAQMALEYPEFLSVGGNTGTVNSFTGFDVGNITGGVYTSANLFQGNNLICFLSQAAEATVLGGGPDLVGALNLLRVKFGQITGTSSCPTIAKYNNTIFDIFPGAKYT